MEKYKVKAEFIYFLLSGVFIACLIASNLIFQKFFRWNPFGIYNFELSVGIIPYPLTFLITDIISEIYGKKRADQVVKVGLITSIFVLIIIIISSNTEATEWSPVSNEIFNRVFGFTGAAVTASMLAYLFAQFIDIRLFHFWKRLTKGKMLWVRNNFSTMTSQFVDTFTVLIVLCFFKVIEWKIFFILFINGYLFKVLVALFDTPFFYFFTWLIKKKFKLKLNDELEF